MCLHKSLERSIYVDGTAGLISGSANAITGRTGNTWRVWSKPTVGWIHSNQIRMWIFKRSSNGKSFDPKMTIQMIKMISARAEHLVQGCLFSQMWRCEASFAPRGSCSPKSTFFCRAILEETWKVKSTKQCLSQWLTLVPLYYLLFCCIIAVANCVKTDLISSDGRSTTDVSYCRLEQTSVILL